MQEDRPGTAATLPALQLLHTVAFTELPTEPACGENKGVRQAAEDTHKNGASYRARQAGSLPSQALEETNRTAHAGGSAGHVDSAAGAAAQAHSSAGRVSILPRLPHQQQLENLTHAGAAQNGAEK